MSDAIASANEDTAADPAPTGAAVPAPEARITTDAAAGATEATGTPDATADATDAAEPVAEAPPANLDPAAIEDAPQEVAAERLAGSPEMEADASADATPAVVGVASNAPATAVDAALASATPLAAAVARSGNRQKVQLRSSVTIALFAVGILLGAVAWRVSNVAPSTVEAFTALALTSEPPVAAVVAQHLAANDAPALSDSLDQPVLDAIRAQLTPLVTLERVTFVNAVSLGDQILAAYVVEGTDSTGARGILGLILVVRDGAVVAQ